MRSCLKQTPPLSPALSGSATPNSSADGSHGSAPNFLLSPRKTVSWHGEDEGLEEVFEADDWDRTPTPVTPRLSYQDILELKQLKLTLPRAPPSPGYRQAFTTSVPSWSSCSDHHPSCSSASTSKNPSFPVSRFATARSLTPSRWKNREQEQSDIDPEILPYLDAVPIQLLPLLDPTQAPEESSQTTPKPLAPRPLSPVQTPSIAVHSPSVASPHCPPSPQSASVLTPTQASPLKRASNFVFVPLLPMQEEKLPAAPSTENPPEPTRRKLNMTFVPLLPVEAPQSPKPDPPCSGWAAVQETEAEHPAQPDLETVANSTLQAQSLPHVTFPGLTHSHSPTSTPSLSSASDTDTESEAPSTSAPSSPSELGDASAAEASQAYFASKMSSMLDNHNPYFPPVSVRTTPYAAQSPARPAISCATDSEEDVVPLPNVFKKVQLQALPSPVLVPPSPFSLYPPSATNSPKDEATVGRRFSLSGGPQSHHGAGSISKRAFTTGRTRSSLSISTSTPVTSPGSAIETIEALRTTGATVSVVPVNASEEVEDPSDMNILGPSFSRKKAAVAQVDPEAMASEP